MTKRKSSGTYVIDAGYNIVNFNQTAKELYPSLAIGVKCYEALMQGNAPCATCPVAKGVMGPKRYVDPIHHSWETVDAVEMPMPDGTVGHALVFSTGVEGGGESQCFGDVRISKDVWHIYPDLRRGCTDRCIYETGLFPSCACLYG